MEEKDKHREKDGWLFYSCNTELRRVVEQEEFMNRHFMFNVEMNWQGTVAIGARVNSLGRRLQPRFTLVSE